MTGTCSGVAGFNFGNWCDPGTAWPTEIILEMFFLKKRFELGPGGLLSGTTSSVLCFTSVKIYQF